MGLLDLFDKLISERGSALVQEKHIALIREQLLAADKKIASLNDELVRLTGENSTLKTENIALQNKQLELNATIDRLTKENETFKNPLHSNLLDELKVDILVFLSKYDKPNTDQIASALGAHLEITKFHLTELKKIKMIHDLLTMGAPTRWILTHEGRKYLIDNKLIS